MIWKAYRPSCSPASGALPVARWPAVTGDRGSDSAAAAADRPAPAIVCSLPVWVTDDAASARGFLGTILADYASLPSYRAMMDIEGVEGLGDLGGVEVPGDAQDPHARRADGATSLSPMLCGTCALIRLSPHIPRSAHASGAGAGFPALTPRYGV